MVNGAIWLFAAEEPLGPSVLERVKKELERANFFFNQGGFAKGAVEHGRNRIFNFLFHFERFWRVLLHNFFIQTTSLRIGI